MRCRVLPIQCIRVAHPMVSSFYAIRNSGRPRGSPHQRELLGCPACLGCHKSHIGRGRRVDLVVLKEECICWGISHRRNIMFIQVLMTELPGIWPTLHANLKQVAGRSESNRKSSMMTQLVLENTALLAKFVYKDRFCP